MTRNPTNGYIVDSGKGGNGLIAIPNQFGFDCARIQRHQRCLTVRENVNRLAPISQTKILTSTFHNGCDHRLKDCRIRTHRNHQLPTWSHSQNSSTCAAFCFRAVCVPFELRWWKRDHMQNILLYQSANSAVPTAAARPESRLLKTVGTLPGHSSNDNVQGGEIKTTVQSRARRTRKGPCDSEAGHPLDTCQMSRRTTTVLASVFGHHTTAPYISAAFWGAAAALTSLSFVSSAAGAVVLLTYTVGLSAGIIPGYISNHLDLAPNFTGLLLGITNGLGSIGSILATLFAGFIVTDEVK
ncbi:hypothetical protein J6590_077432 [Homalodisca vitripennis]|nr:hypothetical protein J6590_077432 [Homalodisca vitripennis]